MIFIKTINYYSLNSNIKKPQNKKKCNKIKKQLMNLQMQKMMMKIIQMMIYDFLFLIDFIFII